MKLSIQALQATYGVLCLGYFLWIAVTDFSSAGDAARMAAIGGGLIFGILGGLVGMFICWFRSSLKANIACYLLGLLLAGLMIASPNLEHDFSNKEYWVGFLLIFLSLSGAIYMLSRATAPSYFERRRESA